MSDRGRCWLPSIDVAIFAAWAAVLMRLRALQAAGRKRSRPHCAAAGA
jgi:hypothetical protein